MSDSIPPIDIFRAYDIRGIVGETLLEAHMEQIAQAFASHIVQKHQITSPRIVLMRDGRLSSPALASAAINGLVNAGATVLDGGLGPTPMAYYAATTQKSDGCMMITGSHNPKNHNGVKFMLDGRSFYGESLRALHDIITRNSFEQGTGNVETINLSREYIHHIATELQGVSLSFPVIWDAGNGAAGDAVTLLSQKIAASQHIMLHCDINGDFPNHHPDPSEPKNLQDIINTIRVTPGAVGLAFDGDGDRLGVVDEQGRAVSPDHLLMLLARDVLQDKPGGTIIADVKTSDALFDEVKKHGGNPVMWCTGHALIKDKLKETNAAFAGEASGHLFFADRYFGFDDALYAAVRLLKIVAGSGQTLAALIDELPKLHASPEWRLECADDQKFLIIQQLQQQLAAEGEKVNTLDGVRVSTTDGWWLIRASNTQAALVARVEGHDEAAYQRLKQALAHRLESYDITLPA